ncbi:MAG: hypothetical protein LBG07_04460, partial [Treponema sp.]|nr:hypothetical protein [Treponema sp.]
MTKERRFWFSLVLCFAAAVPLLLGACLNPVDFSAENLPRIPVDVSGSIDVTIKDVAVFWLINRTKDVDVTTLKIDRAKGDNETDAQYAYPKTYSERPKAGSSLASYHNPTDLFYTVEAAYINTNTQEIGVINALEVQFPRVGDYKYYLYWDKNGNLQLVDENKMNELPPDPTKNYPDPGPNPVDSSYTMVVLNVTRDQNIDSVEFEQSSYTYAISNEPRAKDQEMIYLGAGSYDTYVSYTKDAQVKKIGPKTAVVTSEGGSMAVRTNFLYFYKTIAGDYAVSQTWPPIPNDASDENSPEDALGDNQGILQIINNAVPNNPHALIARININGVDYPDSTNTSNYMGPGESKKFILPVGTAEVLFKPVDQTFYGQLSKRTIESKKTTTLYYVNDMGNPFEFPPDEGNGSGLIQIINNSYGVVTSAVIYNKDELTKYLSFGYNEFVPSGPINNGAMGLIPVLGTDEVELKSGELQLIQIALETNEGVVVLERLASLNGRIVTITINQNDLKLGGDDEGGRYGSKVTVTNSTQSSTNILGMYVYNKANAAASAVYYLDIASPPQNSSKSLYVLSTLGLPILDGEHYEAQLSVYGNGRIALIKKQFSPDDLLYSKTPDAHVRTITLQEADLPAELKENFVPVTG